MENSCIFLSIFFRNLKLPKKKKVLKRTLSVRVDIFGKTFVSGVCVYTHTHIYSYTHVCVLDCDVNCML